MHLFSSPENQRTAPESLGLLKELLCYKLNDFAGNPSSPSEMLGVSLSDLILFLQ